MLKTHLLLAGLWIVYCILHSLLASLQVKKIAENRMGRSFKYYRLCYTIFALVGFAGILFYQVKMVSPPIIARVLFFRVCGGLLSIAGLLIMAVCIRKYFMQLSSIEGLIRNRTYNKLMITGIHQYVRHPLYAGTFLFIWGLFTFLPNWSLLIADSIITLYTLIRIALEENKLTYEFGQYYKEYQQKVPMLIPRLKFW